MPALPELLLDTRGELEAAEEAEAEGDREPVREGEPLPEGEGVPELLMRADLLTALEAEEELLLSADLERETWAELLGEPLSEPELEGEGDSLLLTEEEGV